MYDFRKKINKILVKLKIYFGKGINKILVRLKIRRPMRIRLLKVGINNLKIEGSPIEYLKGISNFPNGTSVTAENNKYDSKFDLSIIVPAYNVEQYIEQCLTSLINQQTKYKYEVLTINDGSTDATLKRIENLQKNEPELIKIINQDNKGLSGARNTGLQNCQGRYVTFVDSDDYVNKNFVEDLMKTADKDNADIVEGNYTTFNSTGIRQWIQHHRQWIQRHKDESIINPFKTLYGYPWGKVYKSSLFKTTQFPENFWYEDTAMMYRIWPQVKRVSTISKVLYNYRKNPNGITSLSHGNAKALDSLYITMQLLRDYKQLDGNFTKDMYEFTLRQMKMNFNRISELKKEVSYSAFLVMCDILNKYFNPVKYKTHDKSLMELEQALRKEDYALFVVASYYL